MKEKDVKLTAEGLEELALRNLLEICNSGDRDAYRIAAAKLLLEYGRQQESGGVLTVVMEGVPAEYCE